MVFITLHLSHSTGLLNVHAPYNMQLVSTSI